MSSFHSQITISNNIVYIVAVNFIDHDHLVDRSLSFPNAEGYGNTKMLYICDSSALPQVELVCVQLS